MIQGRTQRIIIGSLMPSALVALFAFFMSFSAKGVITYFTEFPLLFSDELSIYGISNYIFDILRHMLQPLGLIMGVTIMILILFGIQSILYSFLMEFVVQKLNNDALVILISALLGILVANSLFRSEGEFDVSIGSAIGVIVGYYLRRHNKIDQATS